MVINEQKISRNTKLVLLPTRWEHIPLEVEEQHSRAGLSDAKSISILPWLAKTTVHSNRPNTVRSIKRSLHVNGIISIIA